MMIQKKVSRMPIVNAKEETSIKSFVDLRPCSCLRHRHASWGDFVGTLAQDGAALKAVKEPGLEQENCDFHNFDELGKLAIGDLVWCNGHKQPINPFPEGQALRDECENQLKHFRN